MDDALWYFTRSPYLAAGTHVGQSCTSSKLPYSSLVSSAAAYVECNPAKASHTWSLGMVHVEGCAVGLCHPGSSRAGLDLLLLFAIKQQHDLHLHAQSASCSGLYKALHLSGAYMQPCNMLQIML